jgi:O-antigen ligase
VLFVKERKAGLFAVVGCAVLAIASLFFVSLNNAETSERSMAMMERQSTLIDDPFSNEGLSGRPQLWLSVLNTLNQEPIRYLTGYGIGNYVEFRNAAHNMFLQMMQLGGLIAVLIMTTCYVLIFRRLWQHRHVAWPVVATTAGMLSSVLTSAIFYPNLATGWYLGLYFICFHIAVSHRQQKASVRPQGGPAERRTLTESGILRFRWRGSHLVPSR